MAKSKAAGVSSDQAALIHDLLGQCFETSLRQQLAAGEFNAALLGKILEYLKYNNITVVEDVDSHLSALASAFRGTDEGAFNFFETEVSARERSKPIITSPLR